MMYLKCGIIFFPGESEFVRKQCESEKERLNDALLTTLDALTTHKAAVIERLNEKQTASAELLNEIISM